MNKKNDYMGDILRQFYKTYGRPDEGPPNEINVGQLFSISEPDDSDLNILKTFVDDQIIRRKFNECKQILEEIANMLTCNTLLNELSKIKVSDDDFKTLSNGIFWISLAATIDQRKEGIPITPFEEERELPIPIKVQMTVHGSLIFQLYMALVYMREGVLIKILNKGLNSESRVCGKIIKMLKLDYIRHIRNSLSHGTFSTCIAGVIFEDGNKKVIGTPGFLKWICIWIMAIQLQTLAAVKNDDKTA